MSEKAQRAESFVRGPRERRAGCNGEREPRRGASARHPYGVNAGVISSSLSFFLFRLLSLALGRSASQIIRHLVLSSVERTPRYKSYGNTRALGVYIYTRFVEIVMNLRPTILPPGSRPEGPVSLASSSTSYFVEDLGVAEGCFRRCGFRWFGVNESTVQYAPETGRYTIYLDL